VTIAVGFACTDGFVLCADSEVSLASLKLTGTKVRVCLEGEETKVYMTGAGSPDSFDFVVAACSAHLRDGMTLDEAQAAIADALAELFEDHLYKNPAYAGLADPLDVQLVIGLWERGRSRVLQSVTTMVSPVLDGITLRGSGLELGRYVAERFREPIRDQSVAQALAIGVTLLAHAKRYVQGCGGVSIIVAMKADGQATILRNIDHLERSLGLIEWFQSAAMLASFIGDAKGAEVASKRVSDLLEIARLDAVIPSALAADAGSIGTK
jgi:hypothetical protein